MIVMKFGGTSIKDADSILNVIEIIKSHLEKKPIIVISAIAQATNKLEQIGAMAASGDEKGSLDTIISLLNQHREIVNLLVKTNDNKKLIIEIIDTVQSDLSTIIKGISILKELTPRALDLICSYGEILSSRIIAEVLKEYGVQAEWIDTKDFMITDSNFNRALPMFDLIEKNLRFIVTPILSRGSIPVTQGFIGVTQNGVRTTMGRESSDYSASIIGSVLMVDDIQIWTDVDGVLTADPGIVKDAKKVRLLSFEEAYELSYLGAKVLHPGTMLPALEKNIPIHIYNSRNPGLSGTLIKKIQGTTTSVLKSVSYKQNLSLIIVSPRVRYSPYIFWEHIHNILTKYNAIPCLTTSSEYNYSFVLDEKNDIDSIVENLSEIGQVEQISKQGIVSIIGTNIREFKGLIKKVFDAVDDGKINMISFGSTNTSLSFVVSNEDLLKFVQQIHAKFFSNVEENEMFVDLN